MYGILSSKEEVCIYYEVCIQNKRYMFRQFQSLWKVLPLSRWNRKSVEFPATDAELPAETSLPKPVVKPMKQSRNKPEFNWRSVADSVVLS